MTSRTHDAFAFASLLTTALVFPDVHMNLATLVGVVLAADVGALIPDMDTAGNRLWEMLPQGDKLAKVLRRIFWKHRTITHSLVGVYGMYRVFDWLLPKLFNPSFINPLFVLAGLMIGYISHILSDALTEEGVPLLFPINIAFGFPPVRKMRIKTGKWFESFVVYPAVIGYIFWIIYARQDVFLAILRRL